MVLALTSDDEHALIAVDQLTHSYWGQGQKGIIYPENAVKDEYDITCFRFS